MSIIEQLEEMSQDERQVSHKHMRKIMLDHGMMDEWGQWVHEGEENHYSGELDALDIYCWLGY